MCRVYQESDRVSCRRRAFTAQVDRFPPSDIASSSPTRTPIEIAASLIQEYGSLQNLMDNAEKVKQKARREKLLANRELALLSRELVALKSEVPRANMTFPEEVQSVQELRTQAFDKDRLMAFYDEMGFRDLKRRLTSLVENRQIARKKRSSKRQTVIQPPRPEDFVDVPF